jgi:hypothetical protein
MPRAGWQKMLEDTFGGAQGEEKARVYEVYGYAFLARRSALVPA